jgi:hypothetical protein
MPDAAGRQGAHAINGSILISPIADGTELLVKLVATYSLIRWHEHFSGPIRTSTERTVRPRLVSRRRAARSAGGHYHRLFLEDHATLFRNSEFALSCVAFQEGNCTLLSLVCPALAFGWTLGFHTCGWLHSIIVATPATRRYDSILSACS